MAHVDHGGRFFLFKAVEFVKVKNIIGGAGISE